MVVGVPKDRPTLGDPGLTLHEAQSHMSLWCMAQAVLVATNDVRLRDESIELVFQFIDLESMHTVPCTLADRMVVGPPQRPGASTWSC